MYPILIHSGFYKILRDSPADLRARVRKTLLRLREGQWGGGTRAKRLAGAGQAVFEARVDSGDRLLFTAIRAADSGDPARLTTHLQVWDVVHHDNVRRRTRRNLVPEAEFLDFKALEEFEITEPPPEPAAALDEVSADGTEPLLHFLIPPDGFESRSGEGITGGVRWYLAPEFMLAGEAEFQRMADQADGELELKLMRDQYEILRAPGPLLLAGSAGSGKTTIAIHRLVEARSQMEAGRLLYLSYSPWLVDYARRLYRDVMIARGADPQAGPPHFLTFADLYRKLIPPKEAEARADLVTYESFASWLKHGAPRIDAPLAWEEVRSILKGACLNLGRPMLDDRDYYDLGRKRAPLFVNERPEIFGIAQRYQQWLASAGRADQIDLCRSAFRESRHGRGGKYDVIVCDEVQDLTELEIAFVLSLSANASLGGVMLAGDTQQIVNPTGFRWAEVRQALRKATGAPAVPKPARLRRNCRSVRPLVELANSILALKQEIFGRYEEDSLEDAIVEGPAPIQIAAEEKRVLDAIRNFGPRCAILVLDETEGRNVSNLIDSTRIFHVRDAKGLEFETVILWKLFASSNGAVDRFIRGGSAMDRDARFKQLLHHLYVAVTRARRHLAVFDGPQPHPFWSAQRFRGRIEMEDVETLGRLFRESATPSEWSAEGRYYFERLRYRQAAECYRRAGLLEQETAALAMFAETMEDWQHALALWQRIGQLDRQGFLLEKLGRHAEALGVYQKLGRAADIERLELALLEKQGRWAEAAKRWEDRGNSAEAVRCYQRAGNNARALTLEAAAAEAQKNWKRAAECWFSVKSWEAAARCYRRCRDARKAALAMAHHHDTLKDWPKAAAAYQRAGERVKARECKARALEAAGELSKAAKAWERLGQKDRAFQLYQRAGDQAALDRFRVQRADIRQSQVSFVRELAGRGSYRLAMQLANRRHAFIKQRLGRRGRSYSEYDEHLLNEQHLLDDLNIECKALLAEESEGWEKAATFWRRIGKQDRATVAQTKAIDAIADPIARGYALLKAGEYGRARDTFESAGYNKGIVQTEALVCEKNKDWKQAADLWQSINDSLRYAAAMGHAAASREDWPEAARWYGLAGHRTLAAGAERAARGTLRRAQAALF